MIKTDIVRTVATLACTVVASATFVLAAVAPAQQAPHHPAGAAAPAPIVA